MGRHHQLVGECCRLHGSSEFELKKYTGKTKIMKSKCGEAMYMTCSTKRRRISELLDNSSLKTEESAELLMKHLPVHSDPLMPASCGSEDGGLEKKLILHPWLTWGDTGSSDASSKHAQQPEDGELSPYLEELLGDLLQAITSSSDDEASASTGVDDGREKKLILHPWLTCDDAGCRDSSKHTLQPEDEELPPNMEMLLGDLLEAITSSIDDEDSASTGVDDDHQDRTCVVLAPPELSSI